MNNMIIDSDIQHIKGASLHPEKDQISFIGPATGGDKIRTELASFELETIVQNLSDLGNINHKSLHLTDDIIVELTGDKLQTLICTNARPPDSFNDEFWKNFYHPVFVTSTPSIHHEHFAQIGIQRHLYPVGFEYNPSSHVRLGEVRSNMERSEVLLRNSDIIVIDMNVLRLGDNLGSKYCQTSGLMIEELCQIAKYAGASISLKTIILNGYDENQDEYGMMAKNIALLIYYILDGVEIRQREQNQSVQLQRYTVLPDHSAKELVFIEDQRSGRWWVELFSDGAEKEVKMACTKSDYEDACNNHISERITSLLALA